MLAYAPLIVFLILLWIRPEYMFLLFYIFANTVLAVAFTVWSLRADDIGVYVIVLALNDIILLVLGAIVVTLRKWLKSRKSGAERRADKLVEQARAEAAAQSEAGHG
jgi:hypothetical protein